MGKIKILSEEVANRIAAGEVIERPASVVKECVENAIDACATEIIVKIVNGGKDFIQVIDNGIGMTEDDSLIAFERHATSKISTVDDISHISTMGFRGEALPSIASVSKFHLVTKTENEDIATEIIFSGGRLDLMQKIAANKGTTITIKNLFYNVPARRKFLKTEAVEYKHILNYIHYQALLFPNISFIFYHNNKEKYNYPISNNIEKRMLDIFGTTFNQNNLFYLENEANIITIKGYLQDIENPISNSVLKSHNLQSIYNNYLDVHYIFVNRRFIHDKTIYSAIKSAYEPFLKKYNFFQSGKLPNYIFFIEINPEEIDINVHPAKTEIRFKNPSAVYQFVKETVYDFLLHKENDLYDETQKKIQTLPLSSPLTTREQKLALNIMNQHTKKIDLQNTENSLNPLRDFKNVDKNEKGISIKDIEKNINDIDRDKVANFLITTNLPQKTEQDSYSNDPKGWQSVNNQYTLNQKFNTNLLSILKTMNEGFIQPWQLHNTYIFVQIEEGVIVFDQHAVHERIIYEKLLKNIQLKKPNKQKLIFPLVIDLPAYLSENLLDIISQNTETFSDLGFSVKTFGGNSIVIDEIPSEIEYWDGGNIFLEILEQLQKELTQIKDFRIASAASVACKASIKAGKKLTKKEMLELLTELFSCDFPFQCPHGRPLLVKIGLSDFEKMFKRIM